METDCSCVSFVGEKIILHSRNFEANVNIPFVVWLRIWLKNGIIFILGIPSQYDRIEILC